MLPDFNRHISVAGILLVSEVFSRSCFVLSICFLEAASLFVIIFLFSNTTSLCLINSQNQRMNQNIVTLEGGVHQLPLLIHIQT
jgi:hypothetical protein